MICERQKIYDALRLAGKAMSYAELASAAGVFQVNIPSHVRHMLDNKAKYPHLKKVTLGTRNDSFKGASQFPTKRKIVGLKYTGVSL